MSFGAYGIGPPDSMTSVVTAIETRLFIDRINAAGGSINDYSIQVADALVRQLQAFTGYSKIVFFLPFLGNGINAARVPLIDPQGKGPCVNTSFVDADFSETMGLDNRLEAAKVFDTQITPFGCAGTGAFGTGFYERNWRNGTGVEPIGCYNTGNTTRFGLDLRSTIEHFNAGAPANVCGTSVTTGNKHYYGQRTSATLRALFANGLPIGTNNTTSDAATGSNDRTIWVMGNKQTPSAYWKGTCGCAYLTTGDLTVQEVADLHSIILNYLITPFAR